MSEHGDGRFVHASSVKEAVELLSEAQGNAIAVAGATWIMRAPIRQERADYSLISLAGIDGLSDVRVFDSEIIIGSLASHRKIAQSLTGLFDVACLQQAAANSANPAIRSAATIGGNICSMDFSASDFVPALLALDATVAITGQNGPKKMPIQDFLNTRAEVLKTGIVEHISVPRDGGQSAHVRFTVRKAGEYSIANMSASVVFADDHQVSSAAIAVGSVETKARRWQALENTITGHLLSVEEIEKSARDHCGEFVGRDAVDAPGWYRVEMLPVLARRAAEQLKSQITGSK